MDQALTTAKTAGIIAVTAAEEAATKAAFATMQRTAVLAATVPGTRATYDSLLASAELSDGARHAFVNVYLDHRGTGEELWAKAAAAGVGDAEIKKLQVQGQLTFLTHSEALTTHLQKNVGITDPVQLVDRGFYEADKWKAEAETIAGDAAAKKALLPPAYQTEDVDEGLAAYSADMARTVRYQLSHAGRHASAAAAAGGVRSRRGLGAGSHAVENGGRQGVQARADVRRHVRASQPGHPGVGPPRGQGPGSGRGQDAAARLPDHAQQRGDDRR